MRICRSEDFLALIGEKANATGDIGPGLEVGRGESPLGCTVGEAAGEESALPPLAEDLDPPVVCC